MRRVEISQGSGLLERLRGACKLVTFDVTIDCYGVVLVHGVVLVDGTPAIGLQLRESIRSHGGKSSWLPPCGLRRPCSIPARAGIGAPGCGGFILDLGRSV